MKNLYLAFVFLFICLSSKAISVGSNLRLTREALFTLPQDVTNEILSGAIIANGFTLSNDFTKVVFASAFPVSGVITLNGGTMNLSSDFILKNVSTWTSLGNINGNGNAVELASNMSELGSSSDDIFIFSDLNLRLNSTIMLHSHILFNDSCVIRGGGHILDLSSTGSILIGPNSTLKIEDTIIRGIVDEKIQCSDDSSSLMLQDVLWIQDDIATFSTGSLQIKNKVRMQGDFVFAYQSQEPFKILSKSTFMCDEGVTFSYDPQIIASKDLIVFEDTSSVFRLNGASMHITVTGLNLSGGVVRITESSQIIVETQQIDNNTKINEGVTFGNLAEPSDLCFVIDAGATCKIMSGVLNYKNMLSSSLKMGNEVSELAFFDSTKLNLFRSIDVGIGLISFGNNSIIARKENAQIFGGIIPRGRIFNITLR